MNQGKLEVVKQEMARVNIDILGISELKWTGKGEFNSDNQYGYESWTVKKAEHQRIDAFELWYWRRLLRVPWTARKEIQPAHSKDQSWVFFGRTDAEAETPILWPPHAKS